MVELEYYKRDKKYIAQFMEKTLIIVLVWNDYENTCTTIESILAFKDIEFDILIIDNHSTDGCIELLKKQFSHSNIKYYMNDANVGYAMGNNIGLKYAIEQKYDYTFVLNNDLRFHAPHLLKELVTTLENNSSIGIIAPEIYNKKGNGTFVLSKAEKYRSRYNAYVAKKAGMKECKYKNLIESPTVCGCFIGFRTNILNHVGLFNSNFFMYCEEDELCHRMHLKGYRVCFYISNYKVYHLGGALLFTQIKNWKKILIIRNLLLAIHIFPWHKRIDLICLQFLALIIRISSLLQDKQFKNSIIALLAFIEGLYDLCFYKLLIRKNILLKRGTNLPSTTHAYLLFKI